MNDIFGDALWLFGVVCLLLAVGAGLLLVLAPQRALDLAARLNREFSVSWLQRALDEPRRSEPFFYRHHRIVGILLLVATLYFFWSVATSYDQAALAAMFEGWLPDIALEWLAGALTVVLVVGNGLGFALGCIMLLRPSLLKRPEELANRWVDTDRAAEMLNRRDDRPEGLAHRYPRRIGVIVLLAALYIALVIATLAR